MPGSHLPDSFPGERRVAIGVQAAYDAVAGAYHDQLGDELVGKPLDRDVEAAGFTVYAALIRSPQPDIEYPSRRCYLLAQRH